ncbi:hypothetical protein [Microbacterium sp. NPDC089695]|uniref:hypothetical protein n=1 Tax=Microbacterium sp. NPDC089695 TaxID=3364198 RepID=UPI003808E38B
MIKKIRKRALVAGGVAAMLVAGVSTGGALVTRDSTVFDNVFGVASVPVYLAVSGTPLTATFSGVIDGEYAYEYFDLRNVTSDRDVKYDVAARLVSETPETLKLMAALHTRIVRGTTTVETGPLNAMSIPEASRTVLTAATTDEIRVEVYIKDAAAFQAAGIADGTSLTVDFRFDHLPATP